MIWAPGNFDGHYFLTLFYDYNNNLVKHNEHEQHAPLILFIFSACEPGFEYYMYD